MSQLLFNYWQQGFIPESSYNPKNQILFWNGSDNYEAFIKNPTKGYTETSITYSYNSYGYREEEFNLNSKPNILCLGCSHTEGIGLNINDVWVTHVKNNFKDHSVYNLGLGGGSADTVARILTNTVDIFNPKIVFILWPSIARYETYSAQKAMYNGHWNINNLSVMEYLQDENIYNIFCKNKLIINLLQQKHDFRLVELEVDELTDTDFCRLRNDSPARDHHFGPTQHREIFNRFMEKYNVS